MRILSKGRWIICSPLSLLYNIKTSYWHIHIHHNDKKRCTLWEHDCKSQKSATFGSLFYKYVVRWYQIEAISLGPFSQVIETNGKKQEAAILQLQYHCCKMMLSQFFPTSLGCEAINSNENIDSQSQHNYYRNQENSFCKSHSF